MSDFQIIDVPGHGRVEFPASMSDADIAAAIQKVVANAPATVNPLVAAQMNKAAANLTPPESVTDPRWDAYQQAQNQSAPFELPATLIGGGGIGAILKPGAKAVRSGAEWMMQKALKPTQSDLLTGKADKAIGTLLDEGINVSRGGMAKLEARGEAANKAASDILANSQANIDKYRVARRLDDTERTFRAQVDPHSDLNVIQDTETNFLTHPQLSGQNTMPIQLAQQLKQGTYKQLRDKYGELGGAATEAQKALARGLKEEIELAEPGVIPHNKRASDLFNALNVAERRAMIAGNNNPLGLGPLASNPAAAAVFALDRSQLAKSLAARMMNNSQRIPGLVAGGAIGDYMAQPR